MKDRHDMMSHITSVFYIAVIGPGTGAFSSNRLADNASCHQIAIRSGRFDQPCLDMKLRGDIVRRLTELGVLGPHGRGSCIDGTRYLLTKLEVVIQEGLSFSRI